MNAARTARERARAELTREIKDEARRQLVTEGAEGVSLRAVARQLGMVSSAVYRYFASRDELLTALIIDAYNALGAAAEAADVGADRATPRERWRAICAAARDWARAHPHEYALLYGTPIRGYRAPQDTVTPAGRVALALIGTVRRAHADGTLSAVTPAQPISAELTEQVETLAERIAPELPSATLTRLLIAWTQLFGMLSFELFGQLVGSVDPSDAFFAHTVEQMAEFVGLEG